MARRMIARTLLAAAGTLAAPPALAQSPSEQLLAQSLFDEARALMDQGRYAEACPKLAESQRLDPGGGTLLNLAICHESEGRLGTAFMEMNAALSQAKKDNRKDRVEIAESRLGALADRVPRLTIRVTEDEEGLEVFLDGTLVRKPAWNVSTMVDPGPHVIDARVPGRPQFRMEITLAPRAQKVIDVPVLGRDPAPAPAPLAPARAARTERDEPRTSRANPAHTAATIAGITGFVVGAAGGVGWLVSTLQRRQECVDERSFCTQDGLDAADRERTFGWTAIVGVSVGAAGVIASAVIPRRISAGAAPTRDGAVLSFSAQF